MLVMWVLILLSMELVSVCCLVSEVKMILFFLVSLVVL